MMTIATVKTAVMNRVFYCFLRPYKIILGTSACNNGRFHCRNYGHRALEIPSSRVNDQICDCCDGSDEWDSGIECPNVCKELGAQARKEFDSKRDLVQKGYSKRVELAKEGAKSMEERKVELEKMKKEFEDLHPIRLSIEDTKYQAEQKEQAAKVEEDKKWNGKNVVFLL